MQSVDSVEDQEAVASVIVQLYEALGDRPAFDRHLHQAITIWESDADDMLHGTAELDRLSDLRTAEAVGSPAPASVAPEAIRIDVWGDTAIARYLLVVVYDEVVTNDFFRVTDVLRRTEGRWRIVHHHSESRTG